MLDALPGIDTEYRGRFLAGPAAISGLGGYGGWEAVAHLAPAGEDPVRIADEAEGCSAPLRLGSARSGLLSRRSAADPILAGLPDPMQSPSGTTIRCWKRNCRQEPFPCSQPMD